MILSEIENSASQKLPDKKGQNKNRVSVQLPTDFSESSHKYYERNRKMNCHEPLKRKSFYIRAPITKRNIEKKECKKCYNEAQ